MRHADAHQETVRGAEMRLLMEKTSESPEGWSKVGVEHDHCRLTTSLNGDDIPEHEGQCAI
jgi:hypothetical protein